MTKDPSGFKVVDRRRSHNANDNKGEAESSDTASEKAPPEAAAAGLPPVSFSHFVLSLATSVQMGLGLIPHPGTDKIERDLPVARQTIDLLEILQEKTKGNLSADEGQLLEEVLYTLRMQYIEAQKEPKG